MVYVCSDLFSDNATSSHSWYYWHGLGSFCAGVRLCDLRPERRPHRGWYDSHQLDLNNDRYASSYSSIDFVPYLTFSLSGNGLSDPYARVLSYYDMTCTPASLDPVLPIGCVLFLSAGICLSLLT